MKKPALPPQPFHPEQIELRSEAYHQDCCGVTTSRKIWENIAAAIEWSSCNLSTAVSRMDHPQPLMMKVCGLTRSGAFRMLERNTITLTAPGSIQFTRWFLTSVGSIPELSIDAGSATKLWLGCEWEYLAPKLLNSLVVLLMNDRSTFRLAQEIVNQAYETEENHCSDDPVELAVQRLIEVQNDRYTRKVNNRGIMEGEAIYFLVIKPLGEAIQQQIDTGRMSEDASIRVTHLAYLAYRFNLPLDYFLLRDYITPTISSVRFCDYLKNSTVSVDDLVRQQYDRAALTELISKFVCLTQAAQREVLACIASGTVLDSFYRAANLSCTDKRYAAIRMLEAGNRVQQIAAILDLQQAEVQDIADTVMLLKRLHKIDRLTDDMVHVIVSPVSPSGDEQRKNGET